MLNKTRKNVQRLHTHTYVFYQWKEGSFLSLTPMDLQEGGSI